MILYFSLFSSTRNFIRGHKETILWWVKIIFGVISHRTGDVGFQTLVVIVCTALSMQRPYHKDGPASITQRRTYRSVLLGRNMASTNNREECSWHGLVLRTAARDSTCKLATQHYPTAFLSCVFALLYLGCFSSLLTTLCRPLVVFWNE